MKRNYFIFDNKTLAIHYLLSNVIHNFSPYILSREEELALSYTLGQHVTHDTTRNAIITEFENREKTFHIHLKNELVQ